jgi:hypothetical protein
VDIYPCGQTSLWTDKIQSIQTSLWTAIIKDGLYCEWISLRTNIIEARHNYEWTSWWTDKTVDELHSGQIRTIVDRCHCGKTSFRQDITMDKYHCGQTLLWLYINICCRCLCLAVIKSFLMFTLALCPESNYCSRIFLQCYYFLVLFFSIIFATLSSFLTLL